MKLDCGIDLAAMLLIGVTGCAHSRSASPVESATQSAPESERVVQAACATGIFDMKESEARELTVRIDRVPDLVVGSDIDAPGDAYAADGL